MRDGHEGREGSPMTRARDARAAEKGRGRVGRSGYEKGTRGSGETGRDEKERLCEGGDDEMSQNRCGQWMWSMRDITPFELLV